MPTRLFHLLPSFTLPLATAKAAAGWGQDGELARRRLAQSDPSVAAWVARLDADAVRRELRSEAVWGDRELADDEANRWRALSVAVNDIADSQC